VNDELIAAGTISADGAEGSTQGANHCRPKELAARREYTGQYVKCWV